MKRNFFEVVNDGSDSTGKIKIYGVIGDWWEGNTANSFVREFESMEKQYDTIHIHINSPGGSVHEGLAIANAIKASTKDVHTFVDGIAYSMAAIIAVAAKKGNAHMAKGSLLMLHSASTVVFGNAGELRETADVLDKYDNTLVSFVSSRTGETKEVTKEKYFNHTDNFFTSEEALEKGFIDHVEDYESNNVPDNVRNMTMGEVAAWFTDQEDDVSDSFMQRILAKVKNAIGVKENKEDMFNKFSKLSALAKVAAKDITVEQLEAVNNQIVEAGVQGVTVVSDSYMEEVQNYKEDNETLKSDKTALETKVTAKENRIKELEDEVQALEGKPAKEVGSPESKKGDDLPAGDGVEKEVEDYTTEYDLEAQALFGNVK